LRSLLSLLPGLIRINISLSVTLSAFAAWVLASGTVTAKVVLPLGAIFLLACGASVMNQVREKEEDGKMDRTKKRSLPAGKIPAQNAVLLAVLLLVSGFALLLFESLWICLLLGILNILWYNGFYTWLKKKTAFAVVPGALSGVIPVFMGWSAAGGTLDERMVLLLAFFLFMWQIPHFWLLMMKYGNEYRLAGFPVMTDLFTPSQFRNILLAWMTGAAGTSLILVLSGFWYIFLIKVSILILNVIILLLFFHQLSSRENPRYRLMFATMNGFLLIVLGLIILEKIFS
jgi:protoheme IX farnesyltransferase